MSLVYFVVVLLLLSGSKNYFQDLCQGAYHLSFPLGILWFLILYFKSSICIELIFVCVLDSDPVSFLFILLNSIFHSSLPA